MISMILVVLFAGLGLAYSVPRDNSFPTCGVRPVQPSVQDTFYTTVMTG